MIQTTVSVHLIKIGHCSFNDSFTGKHYAY